MWYYKQAFFSAFQSFCLTHILYIANIQNVEMSQASQTLAESGSLDIHNETVFRVRKLKK